MAWKRGKIVNVLIGTYPVAELGMWGLSGMVNEIVEVNPAFNDEFKHFEFGVGDFGVFAFSGNYDPTDTNGQEALKAAWQNKTKLTDIKFFIDNTSYWTPDVTNDSESGILIQEYGAIEFDRAGVGRVAFSGKVSGQLVLV